MLIRSLQIFLVIVAIVATVIFAAREVQEVALEIQGPQVIEFGLPVFAQFVVTQSLLIDDVIDAKALIIPMHVPVVGQPLYIRLFRNGIPFLEQ